MNDGAKPQAMTTEGAPADDAAGALRGGEAHRGAADIAGDALGRKDPQVSGDADNTPKRPKSEG